MDHVRPEPHRNSRRNQPWRNQGLALLHGGERLELIESTAGDLAGPDLQPTACLPEIDVDAVAELAAFRPTSDAVARYVSPGRRGT
jgi:hypothetical protein